MTKRLILIFLLLTTYYSLHTLSVHGAELKLTKSMETIGTGDTFNVSLVLNTENESINAIEVSLKYSDNLELQSISDGNSIINLWISKPKLEKNKKSVFLSGLIPGGIKTGEGIVLNLTFSAKDGSAFGGEGLHSGQGEIQIEDIKVLLNDPGASEVKVTTSNLNFEIQNNPSATPQGQKLILDFLPPDEFKVYFSKNENIFDNSWFASFNVQDKGSGINHYEIREKFLGLRGSWKIGESPYPLSDQLLLSIIEVKAVDNVERERIAVFVPTRLYAFYIILIGIITSILFFRLLKYLKAKHKKGGI